GMSMALSEIGVKGIQYMKEILPAAAKMSVLAYDKNPGNPSLLSSVKGSAASLGFETKYHEVTRNDVAATLAVILQDKPDVLYVVPDLFLFTQRRQIIDFALTNKIPALYGVKEYARDGGLIALGPNREDAYRRVAGIVDKILKGAKPADTPVEQP